MGSSSYSYSAFHTTMAAHRAAATSPLSYDADVSSGKTARVVHPSLDPKLVAGPSSPYAGKVMRESRDSDAHPNSLAIGVLWDVTGSMGRGPRVFIEKLGKLMNLLVSKGYIADPQILYGAIGDETCDAVPLQIGQFESGNEQEASLAKVFIEGGGGGQHYESYELAMYMMARHTSADCWEKRGDKGLLFIVGDELPREKISAGAVKRLIGDDLPEDLPTATILAELREHYDVYWLFPSCSQYYMETITRDPLKVMFEQHLIMLDKIEDIAEVIAATIGIAKGYNPRDIVTDLVDAGLSRDAAKCVSVAVATVGGASLARKAATVEGTLSDGGVDAVSRL
jgi:hypothetical protein